MPVFEYRAKLPNGKKTKGTIVADSPRLARDQLRSSGYSIEFVHAVTTSNSAESISPVVGIQGVDNAIHQWMRFVNTAIRGFSGRRLRNQVSWFTREIATLIMVGTPMADALRLSVEQSKGRFRLLLLDIREQVVGGCSFGEAIRRHPDVFDKIFCELVSVGEQSGTLQQVLVQAANFREQKDKLKDRVASAMLYPTLVFFLSIVVTVFLMTVVAPTLINSLEEMQRELPWPTRILKFTSDCLLNYGLYLFAFCLSSAFMMILASRTTSGRRIFDGLMLRVPLLGGLVLKQDCSRLCLITATLVKSGVELIRALEIAEGAIHNTHISTALRESRTRISAGMDLGAALGKNSLLPPALIQVFTLGQSSGHLEDLLFQIADDYNHQVSTLADRFTVVIEPILIVCLSVIIGFILMATLLPILETGNALSES